MNPVILIIKIKQRSVPFPVIADFAQLPAKHVSGSYPALQNACCCQQPVYNEHALKAFDVKSIRYLPKRGREDELKATLIN